MNFTVTSKQYTITLLMALFLVLFPNSQHFSCAQSPPDEAAQQKDRVESLVEELQNNAKLKSSLMTIGGDNRNENIQRVRDKILPTGKVGYEHLLSITENARADELNYLIPLITMFKDSNVQPERIVSLIGKRAKKATTIFQFTQCLPLYSNLGLFQRTDEVEDFLINTISKDKKLRQDWPLLNQTIQVKRKNVHLMEEFSYSIKASAATALFHLQSERGMLFLDNLRKNPSIAPQMKKMLDFHFDILERYGSLHNYLVGVHKNTKLIE